MAADAAAMLQAVCSEQKSDAESMRCTQGLLERLAVDPSGPSWLMTGSSRGHLTLWDMRFQLAVNSAQLAQVPSTSFASCMSSLSRDQRRHSAELVLRTCGRLGCLGVCPCCSGSELRGLVGLLRAMDAGSRAPSAVPQWLLLCRGIRSKRCRQRCARLPAWGCRTPR